ncbi:MAG TPA: YbjN domain-containing protein [Gemmataceae bacterium]|nr:YbjN domain-containing protein [Gemmataceae bacterium]
MTKQMRWAGLLVGLAVLVAASAPAAAQTKEKVYLKLTNDQLDQMLKDMGIQAKRFPHPTVKDQMDFDFERKDYKMRVTLFKGTLVWISAYFPKTSLDMINKWNVNAKFSRAVLVNVNGVENAVVEYQIDAAGGMTDNMFRQFIRRFDTECGDFDRFLQKN